MLNVLALLLFAAAVPADHAFDAASAAAASLDFAKAKELYRIAANDDPDPRQRDLAAVRLANIEWRIDRDAAAAEKDLARVADASEQAAPAWIERARLNAELRENYAAAREAAKHALGVAKHDLDRARAANVDASAIIEPIRRAHFDGRCEGDAAQLAFAERELSATIDKVGPTPQPASLLLDAALLANDGPAALRAWRGYYGVTAQSALLAPAAATLAAQLPTWRGIDASAEERRAVGLALADSRFFNEAALVLRDPCAHHAVDAGDPRVANVVAYAAALRSLRKETDEYYRNVALHRAKPRDLEAIVDAAGRSLWGKLSYQGQYSQQALTGALSRDFGTVATLGNTSNVFDLHLTHRVVDEERQVSQYGRTATLRFIALDGIVSNGFQMWVSDGRSGDGGWANTAIYQVRPMYVAGPYTRWQTVADPETRAHHQREMAEEAKRDEQRIARDPNQLPRGAAMRLEQEYLDRVAGELRASGLAGDALRDAFVARLTRDEFETSIWAHEGRHAIDKKFDGLTRSDELEFRAKLSEVALGPAPRRAIGSIAADLPATTSHGAANRRIGAALTAWMKAHGSEIAGLDAARPMLLQVETMTDEQLRRAFRSMDPLAAAPP
jgi:hypothetical protein